MPCTRACCASIGYAGATRCTSFGALIWPPTRTNSGCGLRAAAPPTAARRRSLPPRPRRLRPRRRLRPSPRRRGRVRCPATISSGTSTGATKLRRLGGTRDHRSTRYLACSGGRWGWGRRRRAIADGDTKNARTVLVRIGQDVVEEDRDDDQRSDEDAVDDERHDARPRIAARGLLPARDQRPEQHRRRRRRNGPQRGHRDRRGLASSLPAAFAFVASSGKSHGVLHKVHDQTACQRQSAGNGGFLAFARNRCVAPPRARRMCAPGGRGARSNERTRVVLALQSATP